MYSIKPWRMMVVGFGFRVSGYSYLLKLQRSWSGRLGRGKASMV